VKVTTKAVFDIETLDLLHWEGYEYDGPVALCGKLFANLTNAGVQSPSGSTQFYSSPASATQALAQASNATAQPDSASVNGSINPDGTENETSTMVPTPTPPQPKMVTPSWSDAQASSPGFPLANKELTTRGKALTLLLQTGLGALEGDAAVRSSGSPRTGYAGASTGGVAGARIPFEEAEQANTLAEQALERQRTAAQTAAIPGQAQAELDLKHAQTAWYNGKGAVVGEKDLKPGDILVNRNGDVIGQGADVAANAQAKQTGKLAGTAAAVTNAGGTPAQVLAALGVKNPTQKNTNVAQMYLDANNGDPGAAIKAMNADKVATSNSIHTTIAKLRSVDGADTPGVRATINADPQYSGLKRQRDTLLSKLADEQASGVVDTATVNGLQAQADTLTQKMISRRAQIVPRPTAHATAQPTAQPFTHVSSDGKWGWNGRQWVATGK
jgi:hypothetical protein